MVAAAFVVSAIAVARERTRWSLLQFLGACLLTAVVLAHVAETFELFPSMGWGRSAGAVWSRVLVACRHRVGADPGTRFSEAFLLLAGQQEGMAIALIPTILVVMNIMYAISAYPFGRLADCMSRRIPLVIGIALLIVADVVLATSGTVWQVMLGAPSLHRPDNSKNYFFNGIAPKPTFAPARRRSRKQ